MKKKTNLICFILAVVILIGFGIYRYIDNIHSEVEDSKLQQMRNEYIKQAQIEEKERLEKEAHYENIRKDIPGIVCWGDDMTYGKGGVNKSYPYVLENLLEENEYKIPVYNNGVSGENSLTVLGRQGAIPYCVESFYLKNSPELIEIKVKSSYKGAEVNPLLRKRNPGVNPCSIDGVDGTLYGYVKPANLNKVDKFYFVRSNTGNTKNIMSETPVITSGSKYRDYIHILAVGEHGGYDNNYELVDQHKKFVEYLKDSKNGESYLILGMSKGNKEENEELEKMMTDNFGDHYINIREYLSTNALNDLGLPPTEEDKKAMSEGKVPPSFWFDENNLNDIAYEAIGKIVYNKLVEYNYVKK
ncbi:MAG: hypothetical protein ACI4VF_02645 [Lachnospirales bacterium]